MKFLPLVWAAITRYALNNTLQDILARFERMRGKDVLWQPGTDQAGIATQLIVERQPAERQMRRVGMGEAMALSVAGALIGAAIAWALYNGARSGFGSNVFKLTVSPAMIGMAVLWAVAVALLGGILPSIRAARRPVVEALRGT